jgi:hypothetical protein
MYSEGIGEEMVVAYFNILRHIYLESEENHSNLSQNN